ncbi:hypothetical protein E2C01_017748 [Portunus trituberculatus]|uniref:Uncharacterized protein n=1 Tax=Portunus trituberculatus TaxID=210409 RepID=A0A5B7DTA8_PORTR|nr:hypothetical protein [Portunus trituberculatus]
MCKKVSSGLDSSSLPEVMLYVYRCTDPDRIAVKSLAQGWCEKSSKKWTQRSRTPLRSAPLPNPMPTTSLLRGNTNM